MGDAIALALRHAFPTRIAGFREAAAAARVGEARVTFLPDLSASIRQSGAERDIKEDFDGLIPRHDDALSADVTASYLLLSTTRRLDLAAAKVSREGLAAATDDAKRAVARDAARAYLAVVEADALLRLAEGDVSRRARSVEEAQALVRGGKRAEFETLRAEAELATTEANAVEARNAARIARAVLAQVVGRELPIGFRTEVPAAPADPRAGKRGAEAARELVPASLAKRPDLRAAAADAEIARLGFLRSERRYLPTISLFARYDRVIERYSSPIFEQESLYDTAFSWGGQLEVRFTDTLANRWRSQAARADARAAQVIEDQTRVAASLEIERASLELDRATEVGAATAKSLDAARRNYESTSERYRLGVATQTERVDAEAALAAAEADAARADVGYRVALWNLRYQMGEPLDVP